MSDSDTLTRDERRLEVEHIWQTMSQFKVRHTISQSRSDSGLDLSHFQSKLFEYFLESPLMAEKIHQPSHSAQIDKFRRLVGWTGTNQWETDEMKTDTVCF